MLRINRLQIPLLFVCCFFGHNGVISMEECSYQPSNKSFKISHCDKIEFLPNYQNTTERLLIINNHLREFYYSKIFDNISNLKYLSLIKNKIEIIGLKVLSQWNKLHEVYIEEDQLIIKVPIYIPLSLKVLGLNLKMVAEKVINELPPTLDILNIANTLIGENNSLTITKKFKAQNIKFINCSLSDISLGRDNFPDLKYLDLSNNIIKSSVSIGAFPQLIRLNMSFNRIIEIKSNFWNMTSLELLDLRHNKIRSIQPSSFKYNLKLKSVDLSYNELYHISLMLKDPEQNGFTITLTNTELTTRNNGHMDSNGVFIFHWSDDRPSIVWGITYSLSACFAILLAIYACLRSRRTIKNDRLKNTPMLEPKYTARMELFDGNEEHIYDTA